MPLQTFLGRVYKFDGRLIKCEIFSLYDSENPCGVLDKLVVDTFLAFLPKTSGLISSLGFGSW